MTVLFLGIASLFIVAAGFIVMSVYEETRLKEMDIEEKHPLLKHAKRIKDLKQEDILKQGREQFKKLMSKNLNIPVTML